VFVLAFICKYYFYPVGHFKVSLFSKWLTVVDHISMLFGNSLLLETVERPKATFKIILHVEVSQTVSFLLIIVNMAT
jgi:hypothetical protein